MLTDWISAGANVFAAVGTVGAFISGGILLRREIHRDELRVDEKQREQASKVHAWTESVDASLPEHGRAVEWMTFTEGPVERDNARIFEGGERGGGGSERESPASAQDVSYAFCLNIRNLSAGPIFDVYVEQLAMFAVNTWPQRRLERPDRMLTDRMPMKCVIYRPLQSQDSFNVWYGFFRETINEAPMGCNVAIAFTDCFGLRWRRDRDGQLTRIEPNENPDWVDEAKSILGL